MRELVTDPSELAAGDVVAVFIRAVWHPGIATGETIDGEPSIIHCSRRCGCVAIEPWSLFVPGDLRTRRQPRPTDIETEVVLSRAHARLGRPWSLHYTCEHFVRDAFGSAQFSTQVGAAALTIGGILLRAGMGWG